MNVMEEIFEIRRIEIVQK